VKLTIEENKETGHEEASIELLRTLQRELATLEYKHKISPSASRFIYAMILERAFKMGYIGYPLILK
jgi:ribosomal protein L19E